MFRALAVCKKASYPEHNICSSKKNNFLLPRIEYYSWNLSQTKRVSLRVADILCNKLSMGKIYILNDFIHVFKTLNG